MKTNSSENYLDQLLNSVNGEHTDGKDGLDFYRRIIDGAAAHLKDGGELLMELGMGEAEDVKAYADGKLEFSEFIKDYDGIDRIVVFKKR